jgi:four helix bundle protein
VASDRWQVAGGRWQVAGRWRCEMSVYRNYEEWCEQVPGNIRHDPLWKFETYRRALFLSDLAWFDDEKLFRDVRGKIIASQLAKSAGSVAANIEEGFGRGYGKDYARFLRIALGSAREARGWYYRGRHLLGEELLGHRLKLADEIIRNLVIVANQQRKRSR